MGFRNLQEVGKDSFPMADEENREKKNLRNRYMKRISESIKSCQITLEESKR